MLSEATLESGIHDASPRGHVLLTHRPAELPTPADVERAADCAVVEV